MSGTVHEMVGPVPITNRPVRPFGDRGLPHYARVKVQEDGPVSTQILGDDGREGREGRVFVTIKGLECYCNNFNIGLTLYYICFTTKK